MPVAAPVSADRPPAFRRAGVWLRLAVSAVLVTWILARAPLREVAGAFRSADLRFVLLALALVPFGWLASVRRWRLLIRAQGADAPQPFLLRSFLVGVFFNNLLPSTIGGDAVRAMDTARAGMGRARAVAVVFVDRFVGLLALAFFAILGALGAPALWVIGAAAALVLAACLWFRGKGRAFAQAFAWSLLLQTLVVLNFWLLSRALHVKIPLPAFFLLVPLALFAMMLPVSINGIGVRENVWAFLFAAFGVPAATAVAVAWLDYGLVLMQAGVGGIVYTARRKRDSVAVARSGGVPFEASPPGPLSVTEEGERQGPPSIAPPLPSGRGGQGVRPRRADRSSQQGALEAAP